MSEMKNDKNQIIGLVVTAKDITERKRLEMELLKKNELLGKLAVTDNLTGLYNSRYFYEQIKRELTRLKRNPGRKLTLVMIDVDHFKQLNDSEGHQMGDQRSNRSPTSSKYASAKMSIPPIATAATSSSSSCPTPTRSRRGSSWTVSRSSTARSSSARPASPSASPRRIRTRRTSSLIRRADDALYTSKREGTGENYRSGVGLFSIREYQPAAPAQYQGFSNSNACYAEIKIPIP